MDFCTLFIRELPLANEMLTASNEKKLTSNMVEYFSEEKKKKEKAISKIFFFFLVFLSRQSYLFPLHHFIFIEFFFWHFLPFRIIITFFFFFNKNKLHFVALSQRLHLFFFFCINYIVFFSPDNFKIWKYFAARHVRPNLIYETWINNN